MQSNFRILVAAVAMTVVASANAQNEIKIYEWAQGDTAQSNNAGTVKSFRTVFNTLTNRLTWEVTFGQIPNNNSGLKTDGFHLAMSDGPNPKGDSGELAILYFDGTNKSNVKMTVYGYNGRNDNTSYFDGSPASGTQTPDRIKSTLLSTDWVFDKFVRDNNDGTRTMGFDIDTTSINNHTPKYPGSEPWKGLKFSDKIGVWFHPYAGTDFDYKNGYIDDLDKHREGWVDFENEHATAVPEPATLAALGLGAAAMLRRRRK